MPPLLAVKEALVPPSARETSVPFQTPAAIVPRRVIASCTALGSVVPIEGTPVALVMSTLLLAVASPAIVAVPDAYSKLLAV